MICYHYLEVITTLSILHNINYSAKVDNIELYK